MTERTLVERLREAATEIKPGSPFTWWVFTPGQVARGLEAMRLVDDAVIYSEHWTAMLDAFVRGVNEGT